jgi:hypothetical protein
MLYLFYSRCLKTKARIGPLSPRRERLERGRRLENRGISYFGTVNFSGHPFLEQNKSTEGARMAETIQRR